MLNQPAAAVPAEPETAAPEAPATTRGRGTQTRSAAQKASGLLNRFFSADADQLSIADSVDFDSSTPGTSGSLPPPAPPASVPVFDIRAPTKVAKLLYVKKCQLQFNASDLGEFYNFFLSYYSFLFSFNFQVCNFFISKFQFLFACNLIRMIQALI